MIEFLKQLTDWLYRAKCYFCGKSCLSGLICEDCYEKIEVLSPKPIKFAGSASVYTVGLYCGNLRKMIRGIKYHKKKELAIPMAKLMYTQLKNLAEFNDFEIVPVPLYKKRQKQRGYNHMELVGAELSKLTGQGLNTKIVERIKDTKPQYRLSRRERAENLHRAFKVKAENYNGKKLLLIDDICTTGTTFEEIIREFGRQQYGSPLFYPLAIK